MSKIEDNKKNIDKLYDLYYKATKNIESIVIKIINSMGVMKKSDYATNEKPGFVVDKSDSATCGDNNTIRFGIDANGKWGYIKDDGADTVIPFKSANLQANKNITPTTQQQIILPDSGYDGMEQATVSAIRLQTVNNVQPENVMIIVEPDSGYDGLRQVSINPVTGVDPSDATAIASHVFSGETFYAGNDTKKTGTMARIDVKNSKPFNDHVINVTEGGQYNIAWKPSASSAIINSYVGQENYEGPQIIVAVNVPGSSSSLQDYKYGDAKMGGSNYNITPDSGYDGLKKVIIRPLDSSSNPNVVTLWTGNSSGATAVGSFTASLSSSYKSYTYIRIWFRSNRSYATEFCWMDSVAHIDAVNNTSTNMLAISCRSIASSGQTSGNVFARTFRFSGNTSMAFNNGTQVTSGSGSTSNNVCIPYKIEGIY